MKKITITLERASDSKVEVVISQFIHDEISIDITGDTPVVASEIEFIHQVASTARRLFPN